MNLAHLKQFYAVAKHLSFTKASVELSIAQPSISKVVRQFEGELGLKLLDRTTREVRLTSDGLILFEHAQAIFENVDQLERVLKRTSVTTRKPLLVGTNDAIASLLLPGLVKSSLLAENPVYPVIQTGTAGELCSLIERRKLEIAILFHVPELPEKLKSEIIARVRFHLVVAKKKAKDDTTLECFIGSREVDEEGNKRFPTFERWKKIKPAAAIKVSSNSLHAHLQMVTDGVGISILPDFLVRKRLDRGELVDLLPKENLVFSMKAVSHKSFALSTAASAWLKVLHSLMSN
jgi:DNA-binding transcriptional LysR family regulator